MIDSNPPWHGWRVRATVILIASFSGGKVEPRRQPSAWAGCTREDSGSAFFSRHSYDHAGRAMDADGRVFSAALRDGALGTTAAEGHSVARCGSAAVLGNLCVRQSVLGIH